MMALRRAIRCGTVLRNEAPANASAAKSVTVAIEIIRVVFMTSSCLGSQPFPSGCPTHVRYHGDSGDEEFRAGQGSDGHESFNTTMGHLHPEKSRIKVMIDRVNQQKYVM
jgi:hypothetical protein